LSPARIPAPRRQTSLWRRLDAASRYSFPIGTLVFGLFLIGLPLGLPGQAEMRPVYVMACVFFWSLYRPGSLPAPFVVLAGLLLDLAGVSPLGVWAVLLLGLQGVVLTTRRRLIPQSFWMSWGVFLALATLFAALDWAAQSALTLTLLPLRPVLAQTVLAGILYPALAGFFIRAHRSAAAVELA
jgi:rod shape-determining protein MreD